jgi:fumarate reductase subunit C
MSQNVNYTPHHPKWHRVRKPIFWWVKRFADICFMFRELTSIAVAYSVILLVIIYRALLTSPGSYATLMDTLKEPFWITVNIFALGAVLYHTYTWFNAAPRAMVFRLGKWRVPDLMIIGGNYAAWVVLSAVIFWIYVLG